MKAKRWYVLLVAAAVALLIWTNVQSAYLLAALLVLVPPAAILENLAASRKLTATIQLHKEQGVRLDYTVKNRSVLPAFRVQGQVTIYNRLTGTGQELPYAVSVGPRGSSLAHFGVDSEFCGCIEAQLRDVYCYDFLGLTRRRIACEEAGAVYLYPSLGSDDAWVADRRRQDEQTQDVNYTHTRGNDITQILNIRDYQKGDNIKTIHWKLSRKMGHKMVKELDMPSSQDVIVLAALSPEALGKGHQIDRVARTLAGLTGQLLEEQIFFDVVLLRHEEAVPTKISVQEQNAEDWFLHLLLDGELRLESELVDGYLYRHRVLSRYATVVLVTDEGLDGWHDEDTQVIRVTAQEQAEGRTI